MKRFKEFVALTIKNSQSRLKRSVVLPSNFNFKVFRLRVWNPNRERVREKYFLKSEILMGSDPSCDFCAAEWKGFEARLDFRTQELNRLTETRQVSLPPGALYTLHDSVVQWKQVELISNDRKYQIYWLFGGVLLLGGCFWAGEHFVKQLQAPSCQVLADVVSPELWQQGRREFRLALKDQNWIRAKNELEALRLEIQKNQRPVEGCSVLRNLEPLEKEFHLAIILHRLREKEPVAAAQSYAQVMSLLSESERSLCERRFVKEARKLYLSGYRIEDDEPEKANELMEQSAQICQLIGKSERCFKSSASRTSHQRAP